MTGTGMYCMKQNKMREEMKEAFIKALKEDQIPWHCDWIRMGRPENAVTGKQYRGVNSVWLSYTQDRKGYQDPRWCTFKQAQNEGWKVRKGEKGARVEFWSLYDTETKQKISGDKVTELREQLGDGFYGRVKPISSVYTVFNAEQIEGIPERMAERVQSLLPEELLAEKRDVLLKNMGLSFKEGGNEAFYQPQNDQITMPEMERFRSVYGYMSTFLHEAGHATGHESRLDRNIKNSFGTPDYAREELRAEIASAFTAQELGLPGTDAAFTNHKAYIQDWIMVLEKEPGELFAAIRDAEGIADYLMEKGEFAREEEKEAGKVERRLVAEGETKIPGKGEKKMEAVQEQTDSKTDYPLVRDVAEMEVKLNISPDKRLTEQQAGDPAVFTPKQGVREPDLMQRREEFQRHHMPLFGTQDAAKLRLAARGREMEGFQPDPVHLQAAQMVRRYQEAGLDGKEIVAGKVEQIKEAAGIKDPQYAKNLVCSILSGDRQGYEELMGIQPGPGGKIPEGREGAPGQGTGKAGEHLPWGPRQPQAGPAKPKARGQAVRGGMGR